MLIGIHKKFRFLFEPLVFVDFTVSISTPSIL